MTRIVTKSQPNFSCGGHGVEDAEHHLPSAGATGFVCGLRLDQLGVREDDSELIVQAMEQQTEILVHETSSRTRSVLRAGSRQSVSTKILTDPPAVRTYSTLPPAIQL